MTVNKKSQLKLNISGMRTAAIGNVLDIVVDISPSFFSDPGLTYGTTIVPQNDLSRK